MFHLHILHFAQTMLIFPPNVCQFLILHKMIVQYFSINVLIYMSFTFCKSVTQISMAVVTQRLFCTGGRHRCLISSNVRLSRGCFTWPPPSLWNKPRPGEGLCASLTSDLLTWPLFAPVTGEAYMRLNKLTEAEHWYKESLRAKPDHIPAHLTYGKLLAMTVKHLQTYLRKTYYRVVYLVSS